MLLTTLYAININAFPHRRDDDPFVFENDGFVSCSNRISRELNVSYTPKPLVSGAVATFEVAGRLLIDAPRKFSLHIFINQDTGILHDSSDVVPARRLLAGDPFNFYENFTMPTLSEHFQIVVSLDTLDTELACANKTI
ncbi:9137_t:CDS:1 [Paraglomus brasilianum]|uniref:9137_t:CDS:1 n=1 Tax=Paraglomus brasilianum TaxID=144538 RepID=A0A9N8ZN65_9GLOM|nr:9137_t:CDS:1 [Paraglomus brasilianum]